ncbi:hypothetical protein PoB_003344900 [Plakobranchus ocellatus]|uniref:Uncharacterized protein n=1 Tax=Plakobranchus ocellatus TaxID=259542 RepID=A0AAV4AL45_9GAST|nr:hypothetical protein PoB_003344900 [Plakobranchus ocellatus]
MTLAQPEDIKRTGTQRHSGGIETSVSTDNIVTDPGTTSNGLSCSMATPMTHSSSFNSSHRGFESESEILPTPSLSCSSEDSSDHSETFLKCVSDNKREDRNKNGPQYTDDFSTKSASNQSHVPDVFERETVIADACRSKDTVLSTCQSPGATETMPAPKMPPKPHQQIGGANRVLPLSQDSRPASIRSASVPSQNNILPQSITNLPPAPSPPSKPPASTTHTKRDQGEGEGFNERIYKTLNQLLTTGFLCQPETRRNQKRQGSLLLDPECLLLLSLMCFLLTLGLIAFVTFNLITNQREEQEVCVPCMKLPQDLEVSAVIQ